MKVLPVNFNQKSNSNQNFKGAYNIIMPKAAFNFAKNNEDLLADKFFSRELDFVIVGNIKGFFNKLAFAFANKRDAVSFFQYPGYRHIQNIMANPPRNLQIHHAATEKKLENYLLMRYKLDIELPELDQDYFHFPLLTKKEGSQYVASRNEIERNAEIFAQNTFQSLNHNGRVLDAEDKTILKNVGLFLSESNTAEQVVERNSGFVNNVFIKYPESVPEALKLFVV